MKCPRCRREMRRQKVKDRTYRFVCPFCKFTIKSPNDKEKEEEE